MKIGFLGCGKMGGAIVQALSKSHPKKDLVCFDVNRDNLRKISKVATIAASEKQVLGTQVIFLCVKPQDMQGLLEKIRGMVKNQVIVSIAAGKKISFYEKTLGKRKIARVMPNINALIGKSTNVFASKNLSAKEKASVKKILSEFGIAVALAEEKFDSVTALSGSGPAFAAYFAKCLAQAGEKEGLDAATSRILALKTIAGTMKLMHKKNLSADEVIAMVSSPNGTTVAGMSVLENSPFCETVEKTVAAAKKRSRELGG